MSTHRYRTPTDGVVEKFSRIIMGLVLQAALLAVALSAFDAARIPSPLFAKQNKIPAGKDPNGKNWPYNREWINMSIKNDPIIKVPIGGVLELECEAVGSPPPNIKWYHRTNLLREAGFPEQNEIVNKAIGKVKSRLVIDCVLPHHQGIYSCTGTSGTRKKNPSVTVFVEENDDLANLSCERNVPKVPRIVTWGPTILENIDRDVTLPCAAIGNPAPEVYWINPKNRILDSDTVSPRHKVLPNGDLFISQIIWDDMGIYTCVAQNSLGQDKVESFVYPMRKDEE